MNIDENGHRIENLLVSNPTMIEETSDNCDHMRKILKVECNHQLGRTPSSELLSNLTTLRMTVVEPARPSATASLRKVVALGMNPKRITCPNCNANIVTDVRESMTQWIMPFFLGVFVILLFTFSIMNLNLIFILCYSGGGVLLFVMVYFLNSLFSGKYRHYCPKCNAFIGFEKELVSN